MIIDLLMFSAVSFAPPKVSFEHLSHKPVVEIAFIWNSPKETEEQKTERELKSKEFQNFLNNRPKGNEKMDPPEPQRKNPNNPIFDKKPNQEN